MRRYNEWTRLEDLVRFLVTTTPWTDLEKTILEKNGFGQTDSGKSIFGWCLLQEAVFERMLFGKPFLWSVWKMFGKIFEQSIQESRPKIRGPNSSWKRLGQKAKPGPSKNRFKFQNNNPKTGRRALARRPLFGRRRLRRRVVVLKFVSIFCRTWLGFLAKPFSAGIWPPDFWPRFLDRLFEDFSKHFPNMSKKWFSKKHFF